MKTSRRSFLGAMVLGIVGTITHPCKAITNIFGYRPPRFKPGDHAWFSLGESSSAYVRILEKVGRHEYKVVIAGSNPYSIPVPIVVLDCWLRRLAPSEALWIRKQQEAAGIKHLSEDDLKKCLLEGHLPRGKSRLSASEQTLQNAACMAEEYLKRTKPGYTIL